MYIVHFVNNMDIYFVIYSLLCWFLLIFSLNEETLKFDMSEFVLCDGWYAVNQQEIDKLLQSSISS